MQEDAWELLSYEEKNRRLFLKQKEALDLFVERHAISQEQYMLSLNTLIQNMSIDHTE